MNPNTDDAKYVINVKQIAKVSVLCVCERDEGRIFFWCGATNPPPPFPHTQQFVVGLGDKVAPTDIEEGMRVG